MGPNRISVAMALQKYLEKRAVVQQVNGPFERDGETEMRVHMNDGSILAVRLHEYKARI